MARLEQQEWGSFPSASPPNKPGSCMDPSNPAQEHPQGSAPPDAACKSTWTWEEPQRDSIHGKAAPGAWKSTQQWGSWQEGNYFPPSHPFQALGRARRSRGAAGRAKVTAPCCHRVTGMGWWQEPPGAAAGASGQQDPPRLGKTMGSTGNGNTAQPLTTPQLQNGLLVTPPAQLWCPLSCPGSAGHKPGMRRSPAWWEQSPGMWILR